MIIFCEMRAGSGYLPQVTREQRTKEDAYLDLRDRK